MKSITEFANFTLTKAIKTHADLTAAGKTPEEVTTEMGTTFKMEGDKLKHLINSLEVAGKNSENLKRVLVVSLNEGEAAPQKAVQVEEHHYVPEFLVLSAPKPQAQEGDRKQNRPRRGGNDGPKGSPWGLSPEQKAAKNKPAAAKTTKA
jgi:hypothetical protein